MRAEGKEHITDPQPMKNCHLPNTRGHNYKRGSRNTNLTAVPKTVQNWSVPLLSSAAGSV
jgi:hypothetical protein